MADGAAGRASLERAQGEQHQRHPLDRGSEHPRGAGSLPPPGSARYQRGGDERADPGVVVSTAREVDGEHRVPADERRREGSGARGQ
jgi:hypothetical protein